jgi:hypothetical protein
MLLSIVRTYKGDHWTYAMQKYNGRTWDHQTNVTFWNTLWVIPRRTRHPLDQCAKTTGHTLGLLDVHYSVKELVANFPYK